MVLPSKSQRRPRWGSHCSLESVLSVSAPDCHLYPCTCLKSMCPYYLTACLLFDILQPKSLCSSSSVGGRAQHQLCSGKGFCVGNDPLPATVHLSLKETKGPETSMPSTLTRLLSQLGEWWGQWPVLCAKCPVSACVLAVTLTGLSVLSYTN